MCKALHTCNVYSKPIHNQTETLWAHQFVNDLGQQYLEICFRDHGSRNAWAYTLAKWAVWHMTPSVYFPIELGARFIDPLKGWKAESTLPSSGIESGTRGVEAQSTNHYATGLKKTCTVIKLMIWKTYFLKILWLIKSIKNIWCAL